MDGTLGLLGGGGGVPSGGSTTAGSILTGSKEDSNKNNMVMSAEVSSSYPDEDEDGDDGGGGGGGDDSDGLELGLGLSIGGGGLKSKTAGATPSWGQYARILTAKDFPSLISKQPNSSSSSSSVNIPNPSTSGTKRTAADSVSPPNGNSVVGWPPIRRAHRMPTLANQAKSSNEEFSLLAVEHKGANNMNGSNKNNYSQEENGVANKSYLSVKVNMDGTLIGRKVDLNAHSSYEMLAQTLEDMFCGRRSSTEVAGPSKLLDGNSEFVLTYEDKDGDWMLVGDVPWEMFLGSVKRLRIMRNSESNGLAPRFQEKNGRQRTSAI